ncbi:MAG: 16S rRNA (uracil(1498)-N(3))-methyltransferase [Sulfurimonas sp.]|nr:16S rRNA (uracil(1498)-N(3))-methyltransferase [Sulfurimonas sp.]
MDVDLIYILHDEACEQNLNIKGELHKYLVKVRRHSVGDELNFRNRDDIKILHKYKVVDVESRTLSLDLVSSKEDTTDAKKSLHIAWCVIDTKSIEKVLPSLNEIGVSKISFIYCDRSQKNIKLDFKRFERILEASMQQCGRSSYMEFDSYKSIKEFIREFEDVKVFDFCDKVLDADADFSRVLIGCEGGFSQDERELLKSQESFRLDTPMVLRSESAVMAVASKVLL